MTNKLLTGGLILVALVAIGGFFFPLARASYGTVQSGVDVTTSNYTTLSSANGISNGGIFTTAARTASLNQASTTLCAIQGPNATSSISWTSLLTSNSTSTATTVTVGAASTAFATTTFLASYSVASGAQMSVLASATSSVNWILGPSQWVVISAQGGVGTYSMTGVCDATFNVLN